MIFGTRIAAIACSRGVVCHGDTEARNKKENNIDFYNAVSTKKRLAFDFAIREHTELYSLRSWGSQSLF